MMKKKLKRICFIFLCLLLTFEQSGFAQVAAQLDISAHLAGLHNSFFPDKFRPLHLRYISYNTINNNFKLLLDKGDLRTSLSKVELEDKTKTLLNYFFIGISLPNDSFWVNLRPDAEDNIIDPELAKTDVGKILLEADLQLKKDTAKFTSPETPEGKLYWDKLYQKAGELFGSENITIPTLTRPWIVPDEIIIREAQDNAYIYKATLKVMLEQDYLKNSAMYSFKDERPKALNEYSSQLIRELIIPKLTKEVNTAKRYASLRQVYYSLILAQWFKQKFYGKGGFYSSLIDRRNLNGLTSKAPWTKTTYFKAYQASFKDGEYNIKEPTYTPYGQTIRSYFSGGIAFTAQEILTSIRQGLINAKAAIGQRFSLFQERLDYLIEVLVNGGPELATLTIARTSGNVQGSSTPTNIQQYFFSQTKGSGASSSSATGGEKNGFTPISTGKTGKDRKEIGSGKLINGKLELGDEKDIKLIGPTQGKLYKETINKALDIIRRFRNIDHLNAEIRFCRDSKHYFEFRREGERKIFYIDVSFIDNEDFTPGRIALCLNHLITYYEGGNEVKAVYNNMLPYGILAQYYSPEEFHRGWIPEVLTYFEFLRRESRSTKLSPYWTYRFINDSDLYENETKREIERKNLTLAEMVNKKDLKLEDIIEAIFYEEFSQEGERIPPGLLNFLTTRIRYANISTPDLLQRIREELDEVVSRSRTAYAFRVDLSVEQQRLLTEAQGILERQFQKVMHRPFAMNLVEMANSGKVIFTTAIPGLVPNGFIDELSYRMYLFPETATIGVAIHETIHLVVRTILPVTLDEGYTEYKTRQILQADNKNRTPQIYEKELGLFKEILGEDKQEVLILFDQSGNRKDFTKILGKNGEIVLAIIEAIDILITNSEKKIDLIKRVIKSQYSPESLLLLIEEIERLLLGIGHGFFNKETTIFSDSFKNRLINPPQEESKETISSPVNIVEKVRKLLPYDKYHMEVKELSTAKIIEEIRAKGGDVSRVLRNVLYVLPPSEIPTDEQLENPALKGYAVDIVGINDNGRLRLMIISMVRDSLFPLGIVLYFHSHGSVVDTFDPRFKATPVLPSSRDWPWAKKISKAKVFQRVANKPWLFEVLHTEDLLDSPDNIEIRIYREGKEAEIKRDKFKEDDELSYYLSIGEIFIKYEIFERLDDKEVDRIVIHFGDGRQMIFDRSLTSRKVTLKAKEDLEKKRYDSNSPDVVSNPAEPTKNSSSSVVSEQQNAVPIDKKGGVDFRGLPIVIQPIGNVPGVNLNTPLPTNSKININLNEEWSQIQNMLNAGIIPSSQRIKEYLIACCEKDNFNQEIDKILSCIANILRLQEDNCYSTGSALREILSLLESDKSAEELTFALTNITPQPQEPKGQHSP